MSLPLTYITALDQLLKCCKRAEVAALIQTKGMEAIVAEVLKQRQQAVVARLRDKKSLAQAIGHVPLDVKKLHALPNLPNAKGSKSTIH